MIERHRTAKTRPGSNRNRFAGKGNARSAPALAITEIERRRATRFAFRADNVPLGPCWSRAPTRNRVARKGKRYELVRTDERWQLEVTADDLPSFSF